MVTNPFPPGVANANNYSFFNALSYQIFLGPPIILYAKSLGASATLLGILASLAPLLTIFQIPTAHYLQHFGYRRFVLAGWSARNACVFATVAVPLLSFLDSGCKLALLLGLQLIFNFLRGVSCGAWQPWLTEIVPEGIRPRFLSRDQFFLQMGSLAAFLFCGLVLQKNSSPIEFSIAFLISAISGAVSLYFINRIPDVQGKEALRKSGTKVPWANILTYQPFAKLIRFTVLYSFTTGSLGVFTTTFLKERAGWGENQILFLMVASFIGGAGIMIPCGKLLNAIGPKRFLCWSTGLQGGYLVGWAALALGLFGPETVPLGTIFLIFGMAGTMTVLGTGYLSMKIVPEMGRSHFFAFYVVIGSLITGISPIVWGICLDAMKHLQIPIVPHGVLEWNSYSIYFMVLLALTGATFLSAKGLIDKQSPQAVSKIIASKESAL